VGLTRGSGRAQLARAALEAIAYQTVDAVRAQEAAAGEALEVLKADGGAVENRWLMQFQADALGAPVVVPEISETTALGAAYLAGIVVTPPCLLFYRTRAIGAEHVPTSAPVILAPNHFSQWDHFFAGVYLRRKVRFMAKSQLFSNAVIQYIFWHGGAFPVRRGHQDEEAFKTAYAILDRSGCLLM